MISIRSLLLVPLLGVSPLAATLVGGSSCPDNAALRYWMAFALMDNPNADGELARRLDQVASGAESWDERLAKIVDSNHEALVTMHRGTRLAACDWGLELEMLADAPMGHLSRARALARLNVLYGMRLAQQGRASEAVDAWLAGARFSRDIAAGGPYLSALVAGQALNIHLRAIAKMVSVKKVDPALLSKVERSLSEMPDAGFDWGAAAETEIGILTGLMSAAEKADDPAKYLVNYFPSPDGKPLARRLGLTESQLGDRDRMRAIVRQARALCDELRPQLVTALRGSYASSVEIAKALDVHASGEPLVALGWPFASQINARRGEVMRARAELLEILRQ
jgi:hypothetical protein